MARPVSAILFSFGSEVIHAAGPYSSFLFRKMDETVLKKLECREKMPFTAVDPKTGIAKDYNNSAEFFNEVEEARAKEPERQREVKTFADASKRLRDEIGLDLRDPAEINAAADNEYIEKRIAEGVSKVLEQAQKAEKAQQAEKAGKANQSPFRFTVSHAAKPQYKFFDGQKVCGCKASQASQKPAAKEVIHSRRGVGPVMIAQKI